MKHCPRCDKTKPLSEFYSKRLTSGKVSVRSYCKGCGRKERDAWRKSSTKDNERNKAYNKTNAEEIRGKKLAKNYWPNLTWQEALAGWNRLYVQQNGLCAFGHKATKLHVDHCHTSGKPRGLLCYNCKIGLGRFKDNTEVLEKASAYLKKHR